VRSVATSVLLASLLAVLSASACYRREEAQDFAPPDNESTPESAAEMMMTDAERQAEVDQMQDQVLDREFDASEGANE